MHRYYIYFLTLSLLSLSLNAQHLNERYHFDYPATIFTSLVSTDSVYYINGLIADTTFFNQSSNIFAKVSFEGEMEWLNVIHSPDQTYETWDGDLIDLNGDGFIINGYGFDTNMFALVLRYDSLGEFMWEEKIRNSFDEEDFIRATSLLNINDSYLLTLYEVHPNNLISNEIGLIKLNAEGELIWRKTYGNSSLRDFPFSSTILNENAYAIGGYIINDHIVTQNYTSRASIFQVDSLGNKQWEWLSPVDELWDAVYGIVASGDGGLIGVSGNGVEKYVNPEVNFLHWGNPIIFKLNENHDLVWQRTFDISNMTIFDNELTDIIQSNDQNGFVAIGNYGERFPEIVDSIGVAEVELSGWILKVSPEGDSLWARKLKYLNEDGAGAHYLYDIRPTSDGGYILCGQVRDVELFEHFQQAWLIKVDEYGCVVPGCHLPNNLSEIKKEIPQLLLYPNPVQDQLHVFLRDYSAYQRESLTFRVVNQQGQIIQRLKINPSEEITYMIDVSSYASGAYFLQYLENTKVIGQETFIVP